MTEGASTVALVIRECECPPSVLRCAHWDDVLLSLNDEAEAQRLHPMDSLHSGCYHVYAGIISRAVTCSRCGPSHIRYEPAGIVDRCHETIAAATDTFTRCEAEL